MRHRRLRAAALLSCLVSLVNSCTTLQQLAALRQVRFDLGAVHNGRLAGVDLSRVRSYSDLTTPDVGRVALAVARKDLPFDFVVDISALNPAENKVTARMVRLAWTLILNDKETISGVLDTAVTMPPGTPTRISSRAVPSIDTPLGRIDYPSPITIVSRTVGGSTNPAS